MTRPITIGFISTWPIIQGMTIDWYAHALIQGISAAARELGCNLLLGCGFSATGDQPGGRGFWPVSDPSVDFVPVGPWNTDGLIIVSDELTDAQLQYVDDLLAAGFPIIFTTPEGPGPLVKVDNALGIQSALTHLLEHGHRQIAFVAGHQGRGGDSEERLQAYRDALAASGLPYDDRLVAFGEHRMEDGAQAMRTILQSGAPFSGLIASNDLSCLGAIDTLTSAGRRIPQDVAVVGFDDILAARSLTPPLTTVRHPTFSLGYQALQTLVEIIHGERKGEVRVVVPPRLIIRQSCGCRTRHVEIESAQPSRDDLVHAMAEASLIDARFSREEDLETHLADFLDAVIASLRNHDAAILHDAVDRLFQWTLERGEDAYIWQSATAILPQWLNAILALSSSTDLAFAVGLLDRARTEISDQIQRQSTSALLSYKDRVAQLGQLTGELLSAVNIDQSADILARHLPQIGIRSALVALYEGGQEPAPAGVVLFGAGFAAGFSGLRFEPRRFPIPEVYAGRQPFQLTILPLKVDAETSGFVAFDAPNPELCGAVVHNLAAALRASRLYRDALDGRRMAEEASHLKSRFLSMVSHELRTPLSLIVGLSGMSLHNQAIDLHDLEQINLSAQHLARLIGDVLDLAGSEAGQLQILREPIDLAEVLRITAVIGEEMAREKGLGWQAALPDYGPWVLGDSTRLRQVLLNLISNAAKFTAVGQVRLDVSVADAQAVISVSDTGMGISPAELETVFTEFYRTERTVEAGVGGMGLGLAITRQLVEQHGGKIQVCSPGDLGCGSTFVVRLPIISAATYQAGKDLPVARPSRLVMLLAESGDDTATLSRYLKVRGYELHVCRVDQDAEWFAHVAAMVPSALVLSQNLAARKGWAIAGFLERHPATESIPLLAYALDPAVDRGELMELKFLHKPFRPEQLAHELEQIVAPSCKSPLVLVVDDDPGILAMNRRLVEQNGCQALAARNGREALEIIANVIPDLILLDLMMPEMDGFEVLDALRARESTRGIPVIILTARLLSNADLERCNSGVASILGKGLFSTEETLKHIEAALSRDFAVSGSTRRLVRRAMGFIHCHYTEPITRETIASQVGINADYLTDCFRQELGITPSAYLRRFRIRQACDLLRSSDKSITQVAMSVGFSESAHFTRTFLREMGVSPRVYRRQVLG